MNTQPLAPKFWYRLSAASLFLWACLSTATFLLCSCVSGENDSDGTYPGTAEGFIQVNANKWKPNAGRSYEIDYATWSRIEFR